MSDWNSKVLQFARLLLAVFPVAEATNFRKRSTSLLPKVPLCSSPNRVPPKIDRQTRQSRCKLVCMSQMPPPRLPIPDKDKIGPLDLIFCCGVCHETLRDIYSTTSSEESLLDGRPPRNDDFTKLWMTSCAHLVCTKHLEGGGMQASMVQVCVWY